MSAISTDDVRCESCATVNPVTHAYCGGCGAALNASAWPPVASGRRGYRGPRRMLLVFGVLFVVSGLVAAGAFSAIQSKGASGFGMDVGAPVVNALLDAVGIDQIGVPESRDSGASWLTIAIFLIAFAVAGVSLLLLACASVWLLTRVLSRDDAGSRPAVASVRERGGQEYAKAKPKVAAAAQKGRQAFDEDVKPRVAAGAEKAAARGRQWIDQRRNRPPGGS